MKYFSIIFIIIAIVICFINYNISTFSNMSEEENIEEVNDETIFWNKKNKSDINEWERDIDKYDVYNKYIKKPFGDISQSFIKGIASIYAPDIFINK